MFLHDSCHPGLRATTCREIEVTVDHIHFWPHKDMDGLSGWVISSMSGPPPRQHEHERRYTPFTHPFILTRRISTDDYDGQMIFGDVVGLKLRDISLIGEGKPRKKTSPRKLLPPGDLIRARRVTGAHAIACSTEVDRWMIQKYELRNIRVRCPGVVCRVSAFQPRRSYEL